MRRIAARREHVRVEDPLVLTVFENWFRGVHPDERLFPTTASYMRLLHDKLVTWLGISCADGTGITPASHRAGGATHMFLDSDSVEKVRWHGRWSCTSWTLEVYIQEVAALTFLPDLSAEARARIVYMAQASVVLLAESLAPF